MTRERPAAIFDSNSRNVLIGVGSTLNESKAFASGVAENFQDACPDLAVVV
jgi:hypothetical protein